MGPVKQYVDEKVDAPMTVVIYPGNDCSYWYYEDDGRSFDYRKGAWMGIDMIWDDGPRRLTMSLRNGSRMLPPARRNIDIRIAGEKTVRSVVFEGKAVEAKL
jgi:alpha-glucosidase (family GH31 glycosyl hydrolase)